MGPIKFSTLRAQFFVEKNFLVEGCFCHDNPGFNFARTSCSTGYNIWLCRLAYHNEG